MSETNIVIVGVGGQGVLSASRLLAQAAVDAGERVLVGDTFGASQREGSVMTHVRIGPRVKAAMVPAGSADLLLAFEPYEALRRLHMLRTGGTVVVNAEAVIPVRQVLEGGYPSLAETWAALRAGSGAFRRVAASAEATELAARYGSRYDVTNVIILGAASGLPGFPIEKERLVETIRRRFKASALPMNLEALEAGQRMAASSEDRAG